MSDLYPDDVLTDKWGTREQIERRRGEIANWLDTFLRYCHEEGGVTEVGFQEGIEEQINAQYWEAMGENVRPRILSSDPSRPVRADRHKIASLMELLLVHAQPITHPDPEIQEDLNVRFAYFVAMNILGNWNPNKVKDLRVSPSFDREHRTWLKQLSTHSEGWPIFSNAATWYLVELIYFERTDRARLSVQR